MNDVDVFSRVVNQRRSVRAFLAKPAPADIIQSVFTAAQRAPSNCNTQPWHVAVASGQSVENLRSKIPAAFSAGEWTMDFPYDGKYEGVYKERQYQAAADLYAAMGISREDKIARNEQFMKNYTFFGAPHVAFLFLPEPFGLREAADLGMYAQTLMLSLSAHGLASCPQTALSFNCDLVRQQLNIDPANKLLFGLSFGYEDQDKSVNHCRTSRADLSETVTFYT
ncbi:Nitroreductase NfnB [Zhongshania aliphaticivorans]|uniref:Nitroreductase NfnB n=1 Tax=Zhongshania aliphaticivorans TaxID=1470434 RepID=A0A5S9Q2H4_9GAMM|nr:nitroreductase [Zhongshania aliphaticivorans]CAA0093745.1 Nitroreductase NfnB [Zhongshania aliphaticivorans]CAA0111766.1 Nitroreductase NfnB [Zhongshania aliphaticivorans]